jgi:hypothetical protein
VLAPGGPASSGGEGVDGERLGWGSSALVWQLERKQQRRGEESRGQARRETGTAAALEIWTPGGVTVTRREVMGTEWNRVRPVLTH